MRASSIHASARLRSVNVDNAGATLTPEEARRAIYIDFEGRMNEPPALLGVLYAEGKDASEDRLVLRHDILDPALKTLDEAVDFEGVYRYDTSVWSIRASVLDVVRRAKNQKRHIVSWSRYDATAIAEHGTTAYNRRILNMWYRDGKATARRWRTRCRPDLEFPRSGMRGAHQLTVYLDVFDYPLPDDYGKGTVGDRLRDVRTALATRGDWDSLTEIQQGKWRGVLNHNAADLYGMRTVVIGAAAELAAAAL